MTITEILKDAKSGLCIRRRCWSRVKYVVARKGICGSWLNLCQESLLDDREDAPWSPVVEDLQADDWEKIS